jgi:hypothetical protein
MAYYLLQQRSTEDPAMTDSAIDRIGRQIGERPL